MFIIHIHNLLFANVILNFMQPNIQGMFRWHIYNINLEDHLLLSILSDQGDQESPDWDLVHLSRADIH